MNNMTQTYLLEWLDSIVMYNLNPLKSDVTKLTPLQTKAIISKILQETQSIQTQFTIQIFALSKEKSIKVLVKNYHTALISLWEQLMIVHNRNNYAREDIREVTLALQTSLDELLSFLESRFANFLSLDSRMPVSYLAISTKKMKLRIDKLKSSLQIDASEKMIAEIVFNSLYYFVNSKKNKKVTFREVIYHKLLIKELETLTNKKYEDPIHSGMTEVLIYMNFNSKLFLNVYTQRISSKIDAFEQIADRLGWLLFYYKEFNQIPLNEDAALYQSQQNLKKTLQEWYQQEINFYEKKKKLNSDVKIPVINKKLSGQIPIANKEEKILCQLSTDQTALILRASGELKILMSKSMNHIFKTLVPYLATPYKNNLSYDSMRSKAYVAEQRDKEIAIETLERIIKQIRDY